MTRFKLKEKPVTTGTTSLVGYKVEVRSTDRAVYLQETKTTITKEWTPIEMRPTPTSVELPFSTPVANPDSQLSLYGLLTLFEAKALVANMAVFASGCNIWSLETRLVEYYVRTEYAITTVAIVDACSHGITQTRELSLEGITKSYTKTLEFEEEEEAAPTVIKAVPPLRKKSK